MKFIVDAQLPRRLARRLQAAGHDTPSISLPATVLALADPGFLELTATGLAIHGQ